MAKPPLPTESTFGMSVLSECLDAKFYWGYLESKAKLTTAGISSVLTHRSRRQDTIMPPTLKMDETAREIYSKIFIVDDDSEVGQRKKSEEWRRNEEGREASDDEAFASYSSLPLYPTRGREVKVVR